MLLTNITQQKMIFSKHRKLTVIKKFKMLKSRQKRLNKKTNI